MLYLDELAELEKQIVRRKNYVSYTSQPLEEEQIDELADFISYIDAPIEDVDWDFDTPTREEFIEMCQVKPTENAPHCLILRGERKFFSLQNAGYIGELAILWLQARDIAASWVSVFSAPNDYEGALPLCAGFCFGKSPEKPRTSVAEFDRKPLDKLCMGDINSFGGTLVKAARLAPSCGNRQPARFMILDDHVHIFRKKPAINNSVIQVMQSIDTGTALAHMTVAAAAQGKELHFERLEKEPSWSNYIYQATARW